MKLKMLLKKLLKKGFATPEEKSAMWELVSKMAEAEQDTVSEDVEKVDALPEQEITEGDKPEEKVEEALEKMFTKMEATLGEKVNGNVKKLITEELELHAKRAGVYANATVDLKEKRKALNGNMRKFFRALVSKDETVLKEMSTDDQSSPFAGYVVDSELSAEIRHLITEYGVARREMTALQLTKNSYRANDLVTDVAVGWVGEGAAILSSQVVLGQTPLDLKKLGVIVTMTHELLEDQEIDLVSFIAQRVAEHFAKKEDEAFFKGDGTATYGGFTGLLKNASVNEVVMSGSSFASIDADDLLDMQDETPTNAQANSKYYMHRTIKSYIRKLKGLDGQYIYSKPSEGQPAMIWEKPIVECEAFPSKSDSAADTSFVLYGDLRMANLFGYKGDIRTEMFTSGIVRNVADNADVNLLTTDRVAVRWIERVGALTILPEAVTKLTTAPASV